MVRRSSLHKNAFTMIELVFAIVVIAISIMSLPMMIQTTSKGIENNIVQEAIFASAAILNESTSYYWDSHSLDDANTTSAGYSRVVNTGDCSNTVPSKRIGHINRQCLDNNNTSPNIIGDNTSVEWVATTYNNTALLQGDAIGAANYKDTYTLTATVQDCGVAPGCSPYFGESTDTNSTKDDIKEITITVSNSNASPIVVLHAYTTNIGEVRPQSRIF